MFSTGGEGDREQEPGEGEVSILVPLWGGRDCPFAWVRRYQKPFCSAKSIDMCLRFWHADGHLIACLFAGGRSTLQPVLLGEGVAWLSVAGFGSRRESKLLCDTNVVFLSCAWGPAGESKPRPK